MWMMISFIKLESSEVVNRLEDVRDGGTGDQEFCFEHVKFEMPIKYPNSWTYMSRV